MFPFGMGAFLRHRSSASESGDPLFQGSKVVLVVLKIIGIQQKRPLNLNKDRNHSKGLGHAFKSTKWDLKGHVVFKRPSTALPFWSGIVGSCVVGVPRHLWNPSPLQGCFLGGLAGFQKAFKTTEIKAAKVG